MDDASSLLEIHRLECQRGGRVLFENLSFSLAQGQALLVEGENGSGKTSLLRIISGLGCPAAGEVRWRGRVIGETRAEYACEMAWVGHQNGVKPELSTLENLSFAAALHGQPNTDEILRALETVGLTDRLAVPGRALSAGQKQRLALARLLLGRAKLWILDEPFTALDVLGIGLVSALIERHLARGGLAIMTSHQSVQLDAPLTRLRLDT